ncbi:lysine N(6)-hydroxylase/L-ornithine N(5)-oxygenase family protein [Geomicrobium sediminis]|uniref:L-lysine N6-monooxygenase MbtG n=1 Tax=Geomicrobium sediminis TaxID=1347788 RepID=A0ABS2PHQ2_9BACL|nr:SidA/IucD/PvdA family monooxygenase [Geomicrobium sediminis]MBM7634621.1 lysine N6-hydroxylase [Geomicrobium sediminis]
MKTIDYDVLGVGIGPFNLSLAALCEEGTDLNVAFFDESPEFRWHPGMLIDRTDLQISFLADLITLANPKSAYTFLNYVHETNRVFPFYFFKEWNIPRKEYEAYCRWVVDQLENLHFNKRVIEVIPHEDYFMCGIVTMDTGSVNYVTSKHVIVGTGSEPMLPPGIEDNKDQSLIHSSSYTFHADRVKENDSIVVVGSGQSAAEVFYDLLESQKENSYELSWYTRSPGFFQLEESKLGQEQFTPDYVDHFHQLPFEQRQKTLESLSNLRNGVEGKTLHNIYELLYHRTSINDIPVTIQSSTEIVEAKEDEGGYNLYCKHGQTEEEWNVHAKAVVFATGYKPNIPTFLESMSDELVYEAEGLHKVTRDYRLVFKSERNVNSNLYMLTNLEHSHGTSATNLALSVTRNLEIIQSITEQHSYKTDRSSPFQQF